MLWLQAWIEEGAVELVVPGNLPIGCSAVYLTIFQNPNISFYDRNGCLKAFNAFSKYHNNEIKWSWEKLREKYPHARIIYADYYGAAMPFIMLLTITVSFTSSISRNLVCSSQHHVVLQAINIINLFWYWYYILNINMLSIYIITRTLVLTCYFVDIYICRVQKCSNGLLWRGGTLQFQYFSYVWRTRLNDLQRSILVYASWDGIHLTEAAYRYIALVPS